MYCEQVANNITGDNVPAIKTTCPSCGEPQGVSLVWGEVDLLDEDIHELTGCGEMVFGGDAIAVNEHGYLMSTACLSCGAQWITASATDCHKFKNAVF